MEDDPALLTSSDLERCLEHVQATAAGPCAGVFGPASALWHVDREAVLFVGAGRALLMQLAHPWVATAIVAHSTALDDPIARFHRTFEIVFKLVFGSSDQALATARRLHRLHAAVRGSMPERLGPYAEGAPYFATRCQSSNGFTRPSWTRRLSPTSLCARRSSPRCANATMGRAGG